MSGYAIAHVDEIEELDDGRCPMRPVRHHFGITAFGVTAWTGHETGDRIINEHEEEDPYSHEELYLVLRGHARFELAGEPRDAPAGTFVYVPPGVKRTAFAEEAGTTIVAVGGSPGKPYDAVGWELWSPLRGPYEAGEYDEVVKRGRELVAENPQYALLFYNLACCESLAGDKAEALEHLRQAIEKTPQLRDFAKEDSDLDAIRSEPGFADLVPA